MNVLGLCTDPGVPLDGVKGASVHLVSIWNALARAGCRVHGVAHWRGGPLPACAPELTLHPLPADPGTPMERVSRAASGVEADVILERLALDGAAGAELARVRGLPRIVEVNAPLDEEAARYRDAPQHGAVRAMSRSLAEAEGVYVVSSALKPWARRHGARDVLVLPNGVEVAAFSGARATRKSGPARAIFVGTFKPWHGVDLLVDAAGRAIRDGADLELELVGEGPGRADAEARVREFGIADRVRFSGTVAHEDVPARLLAADIAVAPAPRDAPAYFSPLKLCEYAAAGCAIVAADGGQVGERFRHGHDAWLVAPGDAGALADGLRRLAHDRALRERLGAAARRTAAAFDWSEVAVQLTAWMESLVHHRTRS